MSSSFLSTPAGSLAPLAAELDPLDEGDDSFDAVHPQDSSSGSSDNDEPPAAPTSSAEPLRAERRRSNQLEKELRKARAQLSRFSEINPYEYARLQNLRKERLLERLFSEAEGRVGGDERGTFFDTFVTLCDGDYMEELRRAKPADPEHRRALPGGRQSDHPQSTGTAPLPPWCRPPAPIARPLA